MFAEYLNRHGKAECFVDRGVSHFFTDDTHTDVLCAPSEEDREEAPSFHVPAERPQRPGDLVLFLCVLTVRFVMCACRGPINVAHAQ